jgi:AcrR family transcriptional regulator
MLQYGGEKLPPKARFSKREIIEAAISIVRRHGMQGLTARALGSKLKSSARPVFTAFQNMDEVSHEVIERANEIYHEYLNAEMAEGKYPPYKASGMGYIRFAKEERELFKLLFMRDRSNEKIGENREEIRPILELIQKNMDISEDEAFLFHLEMWIYVHGIATMFATSYLNLDEAFIDEVLTDAFQGLKVRWKEKAQTKHRNIL